MQRLVIGLLCCSIFSHVLARDHEKPVDAVLIGGGIMSATLGALLKELDPNLSIEVFEKLDNVAGESSAPLNNAGTGHSGYCELNYTPERKDGSIDIKKAIEINEAFELSRQFWAFLVEQNKIASPKSFINRVPHMVFVWGEKNINYLKKRHDALIQHPQFQGMEYTEDRKVIEQWIPLVMEGRGKIDPVAATRMPIGADVNYGALTNHLFSIILESGNANLHLSHEVKNLKHNPDSTWTVVVKDLKTKGRRNVKAKFVFIGAGGGSFRALQKSGIAEGKGYGGFPVGGQWLISDNQDLVTQHFAKVYGRADLGSPPMSVPHLDRRVINGKQTLLFGPFATLTTKTLKKGSRLGLLQILTKENIIPTVTAGAHNLALIKYMMSQSLLTPQKRLKALQKYFPNAKLEDWRLERAGQRVQIVKNDGSLQFGTELISSQDDTLVALLGASPGASTAVDIMLKVLHKSFKEELASSKWQEKLHEMIPSYGHKLSEDPQLLERVRKWDGKILGLIPEIKSVKSGTPD